MLRNSGRFTKLLHFSFLKENKNKNDTVTSSIVQALSFTGASYMFKLLEPNKYGKEQKRYHLALEKLQAAKEKFLEEETIRRDIITALEKAKANVSKDFAQTNALFNQLTDEQNNARKPILNDFYKPSPTMTHYNNLASGLVGLVTGSGITALVINYLL